MVHATATTATVVKAPDATEQFLCTAANFPVTQWAHERGSRGFTVGADTTITLSGFGVPETWQPRVRMLEITVDQDGCTGAELPLFYRGIVGGTR